MFPWQQNEIMDMNASEEGKWLGTIMLTTPALEVR
jgi:hypothetical protein